MVIMDGCCCCFVIVFSAVKAMGALLAERLKAYIKQKVTGFDNFLKAVIPSAKNSGSFLSR
jgi:hypothetical protein